MLAALVRYAETHDLTAEPGFKPKPVRWAIVADRAGKLLQVLELGDASGGRNPGRTFRKCPHLEQPELVGGGAGCRHFLVDALDVVTLYGASPDDDKLRPKHAYFVGLLRRIGAPALPELGALADLLDAPEALAEIHRRLAEKKARPTEPATVALYDGELSFPVDSDAWHDAWRAFRRTLAGGDGEGPRKKPAAADPRVRCLASGELVTPLLTHFKVSGLADVGGHSAGDVLASFERDSFSSYGLSQAENSPVSEEKVAAYRAALNHLIQTESRRIAGARVVPWFRRWIPPDDNPFVVLDDPGDPEGGGNEAAGLARVRALLAAIDEGTSEATDLAGNTYHVLTLSGVSGRVMVRDYLEGPLAELVQNVNAWFDDLSIVRREGGTLAPPPKFFAVLGGLVRDLSDVPPPLSARLFRAAVRREPIPRQALAMALSRFRAALLQDEPFHHARLGLLKAFHCRQGELPMEPTLNPALEPPAYHCGRLLAVLAAVQYRALGDVGAGVVQRFYAAASATPALVLGRLVRTAQFHLDKLDRGLARFHDGRIAEVMAAIGPRIPRTLTLEEQSLFALGYYQQIAEDRRKTADPAEARKAATAEETADV